MEEDQAERGFGKRFPQGMPFGDLADPAQLAQFQQQRALESDKFVSQSPGNSSLFLIAFRTLYIDQCVQQVSPFVQVSASNGKGATKEVLTSAGFRAIHLPRECPGLIQDSVGDFVVAGHDVPFGQSQQDECVTPVVPGGGGQRCGIG